MLIWITNLKLVSLRSRYGLWICIAFSDVDCLLHQTRTSVCLKATSCFLMTLKFLVLQEGFSQSYVKIPSPSPCTLVRPEQGYDPGEAMPANLADITRTAKPFHFYLGAVLMEATFRNLVQQLHHSLMQEHWLHYKCHLLVQPETWEVV